MKKTADYYKDQEDDQDRQVEHPRSGPSAFVPDLDCIPDFKTLPYWLVEILDLIA
ncbi:hypothetical protein [Desulfatibacillum aliphaticivorans]|uniref:hypothetical protein n=1 Tax=Desulfatibacillum aliphaticivorans TaxID=218208 RepID=UPI00040966D3|nr:hypothetical protein [Desulfatibacillum aliphaticivorans]